MSSLSAIRESANATPRPESIRGSTNLRAGHASSHPAYRADIDGLRAVAVLSVVGFHAFPGTVKGGFVGVDIFFIISGFLISTILFGNLAQDSFDILEFYVRRVRRIFPALLVVMVATFVFGWFSLMDDEYRQLGKQLAGGAGFVSNFVFWHESGYFDASADTKPLLHLWSLGIEEQFYIFWPVLLLATRRFRIDPLTVTIVTAIISFGFNVHLATNDIVADFYSPYTRFWELSLGSILAYLTVFDKSWVRHLSPVQRDIQSVVGASLLVVALVVMESSDAFPGWWALLPTMGAVLLIASGSFAWVNRRILSSRLLVWLGLISFPLYLWHWPILSFIRILAAERPTRLVRIAAIVAAIALAWLTYRFIETPLRRRGRGSRLPATLVAAMAVVGVTGFVCYAGDAFTSRSAANPAIVNDGDLGQEGFFQYVSAHFVPCDPPVIRSEAEQWNGLTRCMQSRAGQADLAIVGDSHAEHLFAGLAEALPMRNVVFYTKSSLPVASNAAFDHIFATVVADPHIRTVVLSAWWTLRFGELPGGTSPLQALQSTLEPLLRAGKTVYIADDVPNFSFSPRLCKYQSSGLRVHRCADEREFYDKQLRGYEGVLDRLAEKNPDVHVLKLSRYFCDASNCSMRPATKLLFRDSDHMSIAGSQYVGERIAADYPTLRAPPPP